VSYSGCINQPEKYTSPLDFIAGNKPQATQLTLRKYKMPQTHGLHDFLINEQQCGHPWLRLTPSPHRSGSG
jgi:hypothetical protein